MCLSAIVNEILPALFSCFLSGDRGALASVRFVRLSASVSCSLAVDPVFSRSTSNHLQNTGILPLSHLCSSYFMIFFLVFCGKEQAQGSSQAGAPSGQQQITPCCPSTPGTHPSGSEGCRPRCTFVRKCMDEAHPGPRHPTLQGADTAHPQWGNAGCCNGGCGCVVTIQASLSVAGMVAVGVWWPSRPP